MTWTSESAIHRRTRFGKDRSCTGALSACEDAGLRLQSARVRLRVKLQDSSTFLHALKRARLAWHSPFARPSRATGGEATASAARRRRCSR
eukprot:4619807-Pleurochrysis_carterae.AAC.1